MDEFKVRMNGLPAGLVSALLVTLVLFIALPLLTQFQPSRGAQKKTHGILISSKRPPPPPSETRDEPKKQEMEEKKAKKQNKQQKRARPKFATPKVSFGMDGGGMGGVKIAMKSNFNISDSLFMSAFNLNEVDSPPRALRTFPPQYPFLAKRDGIEGRVVLKFVVDVSGAALEAEVVSGEPEGVFDAAALKAIARYKFKPAMKGGKAVNCIAKLPISFTMD